MGQQNIADESRDKALVSDYKLGGLTLTELGNRWNISTPIIYKILNRYNIPRNKNGQKNGE